MSITVNYLYYLIIIEYANVDDTARLQMHNAVWSLIVNFDILAIPSSSI